MPAATTRDALIAVTTKEYAKLKTLISGLPADMAQRTFDDDTSIKDVIIHRAHWCALFFRWLDQAAAGGPVYMPDEGVKWNQLKPYNAALRERYADMSWADAQAWLDREHSRLLTFIEAETDQSLYGGPFPMTEGWTTGRYAEASGPSHYRSAAKFIRACLRSA
ncbi:ClbS/DfsB family four-helix bundle protein [Rhodophyticola sp. CCM32]|uniref:ClbS/DfsB family four-helix bundle protein n=1 Tax=Rhodophyticola sp. CCM32 TaxID=2916397 RepID=UPI00107F9D66|nr:ClbS/DfsB family four-helix bundle protein [Rhodophyticola sp. CCM32]QBY01536.1 ClbS/DfsB family four-helix bundle protein [Rhodophyticola sp. CCM32]